MIHMFWVSGALVKIELVMHTLNLRIVKCTTPIHKWAYFMFLPLCLTQFLWDIKLKKNTF